MLSKSIKLNAILSSIKMVLSTLISLVTFPYISRVLQVEAVGQHNFAVSVISYFVMLVELGVATYAVREGARLREDRIRLSRFVSEIFTLQTIAAAISMTALACAILFVPKLQEYWLLLLILGLQIPLTAFGRAWLYNIEEEFGLATLTQFAFQLVSVVLMFVFVRSPEDLYKYTITYLLSNAGCNVIYGLHSRKYVDIKPVPLTSLKKHIKPIMVIFSTNIAMAIYVNSDVTILGWMVNDEAVGLYSISVKVYTIVKQVVSAIITVAIPRLTLHVDTDRYKPFFSKVLNALILILLPAVTGLFFLSGNVVEIISGPEYLDATMSMRILSLALAASMFACLYALGCLIPHRQEKLFLIATIVSSVVNILLNFLLIPRFHQNATAFTTLLAELIVWGICYFYSREHTSAQGSKRNVLTTLASCGAIAAVCLVVQKSQLNLYVETAIAITFSVMFYGLIQLALKNTVFLQLAGSVFHKLKKSNQS